MNKLKTGHIVNHQTFGDGIIYRVSPSIASVMFFSDSSKHDILESFLGEPLKEYTIQDLINFKVLSAFFDQKTIKKAHEYVNTTNITHVKFDENCSIVSAMVIGTRAYLVRFELTNNKLTMECDCPVGGLCKHQAAFALFLERKQEVKKDEPHRYEPIKVSEKGQELTKLFNKSEKLTYETLSNIKKLLIELRSLEPYEVVKLLLELPLDYSDYPYHIRALASNDTIISRLRDYGVSNLDDVLVDLYSIHKTFEPTYYEMKRDLINNDDIADKVNLYNLFNLNYYSLSHSLIAARRTSTTRLIAAFAAVDLLSYMHKTPFLGLLGGDKNLLREAYENIEDKEKKLDFYFNFEKELMQAGVINDSFSIKDRIAHLTHVKDKTVKLNSIEVLVPIAIKSKLYQEASEVIVSYLCDQDFRLTYREVETLHKLVSGVPELKLIEKIIKGEEIYG